MSSSLKADVTLPLNSTVPPIHQPPAETQSPLRMSCVKGASVIVEGRLSEERHWDAAWVLSAQWTVVPDVCLSRLASLCAWGTVPCNRSLRLCYRCVWMCTGQQANCSNRYKLLRCYNTSVFHICRCWVGLFQDFLIHFPQARTRLLGSF